VFVYLQALLEKYEKEKQNSINELENKNINDRRKTSESLGEDIEIDENKEYEKQDKLGTKYNPVLPISHWDSICKQSFNELESNIKLREDLKISGANLKEKIIKIKSNLKLLNKIPSSPSFPITNSIFFFIIISKLFLNFIYSSLIEVHIDLRLSNWYFTLKLSSLISDIKLSIYSELAKI